MYKANRAIAAGLVMLLVAACADRSAPTFVANSGPNAMQRRSTAGVVQTLFEDVTLGRAAFVYTYPPPYLQREHAIRVYKEAAAMASDSNGDLFVVEGYMLGTFRLRVFRPPYDRPVADMPLPTFGQGFVALATNANLFVSATIDNDTKRGIAVYAPPYTPDSKPISELKGLKFPTSLAMDRQGDLIVNDDLLNSSSQIVIYPPPYDGTGMVRIPTGSIMPTSIAVDSKGDIFGTNYHPDEVYEFRPPYAAAPRAIGRGTNIAVNSKDELFVSGSDAITMYAYPYTTLTLRITAPQLGCPGQLAFDDRDDLFVAQGCYSDVARKVSHFLTLLYEPPYTSAPRVIAPKQLSAGDIILAPSTPGPF
jgi:hypothetical protein